MENTGEDASWINGNNERHNRSIQNMVISGLIDSDQHANKWCCTAETSSEVHRCKLRSVLENTLSHFEWYGQNPIIHEIRKFVCDIYPITSYPKRLDYRTQ